MTQSITEQATEMVDTLNRHRVELHRIAQQEKIRATIATLIAKGRSAEQILESLRRNAPVVSPFY